MEDKWLSYSIENCIYVHRSWSGHLMYKFTIHNKTIDYIEIAMDDFVNMENERKIEIFFLYYLIYLNLIEMLCIK